MDARGPNMISNVTQFRVDLYHLAARISATISKGNTPFTRLLIKKKSGGGHFLPYLRARRGVYSGSCHVPARTKSETSLPPRQPPGTFCEPTFRLIIQQFQIFMLEAMPELWRERRGSNPRPLA